MAVARFTVLDYFQGPSAVSPDAETVAVDARLRRWAFAISQLFQASKNKSDPADTNLHSISHLVEFVASALLPRTIFSDNNSKSEKVRALDDRIPTTEQEKAYRVDSAFRGLQEHFAGEAHFSNRKNNLHKLIRTFSHIVFNSFQGRQVCTGGCDEEAHQERFGFPRLVDGASLGSEPKPICRRPGQLTVSRISIFNFYKYKLKCNDNKLKSGWIFLLRTALHATVHNNKLNSNRDRSRAHWIWQF